MKAMMTHPLAAYFFCIILFTAIDMVWLVGVGRGFYTSEIGGLLRQQPLLSAAVLFYILYPIGLVAFAIWPGFGMASPVQAMKYGALLGLVAYGTYDLTNMAVVQGFTWRIALIDLAWGTALSAVAAGLTTRIMLLF